MIFEVTILGSASAIPDRTRYPSAQLLNLHGRLFLVDCGEGTQLQLIKLSIGLQKIENIFISHLHGDHFFGLPGLISSMHLVGREQPLHIYADSDLKQLLLPILLQSHFQLSFDVVYHELNPSEEEILITAEDYSVRTVLLDHGINTWGFVFEEVQKERNISKEFVSRYQPSVEQIKQIKKGTDYQGPDGKVIPNDEITIEPPEPRSYAYCSDTRYFQDLAGKISPASTLYHEASYLEEDKDLAEKRNHATAGQAAVTAKNAGCGKLITGHFSARYRNIDKFVNEMREIFENSHPAEDLETYQII